MNYFFEDFDKFNETPNAIVIMFVLAFQKKELFKFIEVHRNIQNVIKAMLPVNLGR